MFQKLVAIEPVSLIPSAEEALHQYAREVVLVRAVPADADENVRRIGDADAVLLSYTSRMGRDVIARCPDLRYIGMCCSLYSEKSANVDIAFAREKGIRVLGIRDYGDRGVVEYVLHELTGLLHGFGMPMLRDEPVEIFGLRVGVVGLGVSGRMIADALAFLGADISYYSRSRKCLWHKGGTSGHVQKVKSIRLDCDGDAVVLLIEQIGGAACHEGYRSCFSRELRDGKVSRCSELVFDPKEVYNG